MIINRLAGMREELDVIELYALYRLCKYLGAIVRSRGRNPVGLQFLLVILWFVFEFVGGILTQIVCIILEGPREGAYPVAYLGALVAAGCGAAVAFLIARSLPDRGVMAPAFPVDVAEPAEAQAAPADAQVGTERAGT